MHHSLLWTTATPNLVLCFVSCFLFNPFLTWLPLQQNFQVIREWPEDIPLDSKISIILEHSPEITQLLDTILSFHWLMFFWQWHPTLMLDNCKLWRKLSHTIWPQTCCFLRAGGKMKGQTAPGPMISMSQLVSPCHLPQHETQNFCCHFFLRTLCRVVVPIHQNHSTLVGFFVCVCVFFFYVCVSHWGSFGLAKRMPI